MRRVFGHREDDQVNAVTTPKGVASGQSWDEQPINKNKRHVYMNVKYFKQLLYACI